MMSAVSFHYWVNYYVDKMENSRDKDMGHCCFVFVFFFTKLVLSADTHSPGGVKKAWQGIKCFDYVRKKCSRLMLEGLSWILSVAMGNSIVKQTWVWHELVTRSGRG